jgi:hypothetical protein
MLCKNSSNLALADEYQMDVGSRLTAVSSTLLLWCGLSATLWGCVFFADSALAALSRIAHSKAV